MGHKGGVGRVLEGGEPVGGRQEGLSMFEGQGWDPGRGRERVRRGYRGIRRGYRGGRRAGRGK